MAMNALMTLLLALGLCSCSFEAHVGSHQNGIYFGNVKDTNTEARLSTFCATRKSGVDHSSVIVFSAAPGSFVEEEVLFEDREEEFAGSIAPERDDAFWCSGVPELYLRNFVNWICLHSTDSDPPATILAVEPRGQLGNKDLSSGYALKLQVRHPGVLHVAFDAQCLADHTDSYFSGEPVPWGELTIQ